MIVCPTDQESILSDTTDTPRVYFDEHADKPAEPMDLVRAYRDLKRERKEIGSRDKELIRQEGMMETLLLAHMEAGRLPHSIPLKGQGGGNVHTRNEIRPKLKPDVSHNEARTIFEKCGLGYMFSDRPNSQSLMGYIKQYLSDDETLAARERVDEAEVPSELLDILIIEDNYKVAANGL